MRRATLLMAGLSFLLATGAKAVDFDLIVPKKLIINTSQHSSNIILARYWGMVIATNDLIGESNILDAEVSFTIDDPAVSGGETGFLNVPQATPIAKKTAAGGRTTSPQTDLLKPDETHAFLSPLYVLNMGGWGAGHQGTAKITASMTMGFHRAEYETEVVFVFEPDEGFLIKHEEAQRVTAKTPPFLPDLIFDEELEVRFPPFPTPTCDEPEPEPVGCTTLCKPCKRYFCENGEWVAHEEMPPEGVCRSKRGGTPYSKGKRDEPVVACPRTTEDICPTECDLCW